MATNGPYSELEYLILAMVGENISSGYAMRKEMTRMRGGRWSAESGSVYRVLRRLVADGLVREARRVGVPNRERTEYELTPQGDATLASWLTFAPDRQELAFLVDPLRTRAFFLQRLRHPDQVRVVKTWIAENKSFLADLEREMKASEPKETPLRRLAVQNLLILAQARQEWLKRLQASLRSENAVVDAPESSAPVGVGS